MPPLIISNFQKGQSRTPYMADGAFAKSQNVDIFSQEGIARINYLPVAYSGSAGNAVTDLPTQFEIDPYNANIIYFCDNSRDVYSFNTSTNTVTKIGTNKGNQIKVWNDYLIAIRDSSIGAINCYGLAGGSWSTITGLNGVAGDYEHYILSSSKDGKIYIANNFTNTTFKIATLVEVAGKVFTPSDNTTWTLSATAFALPERWKATGLSEIGRYIVVAMKYTTQIVDREIPQTMFGFWDRSATTFDYMLTQSEYGLGNIVSMNEGLYVTGGSQGNIYQITESGLSKIAQIPFDYDSGNSILIGSIGEHSIDWWNDRLVIGVSSEDGLYPAGIYSMRNGVICHEFLQPDGDDGSVNDIYIGGVMSRNVNELYFGWKRVVSGGATTYGIAKVSTSGYRFPSYTSYLESGFYPVGAIDQKKSFNNVKVQLARPLQTGEGVRIKYRKNINDSWTTLGTQDYTTNGAVSSLSFPGIHNVENVQVRIELTTGASSSNTPYILAVYLI
ncbi:MAG: hypothetical protein WC437_04635 [Patescibacteria group bacterium]